MERLTYRTIKGEAMGNSSVADIGDILEKLAEYEDLEEQGLLLRLPVKAGDIVYIISRNNEIIPLNVHGINIRKDDFTILAKNEKYRGYSILELLSKYESVDWFLTKAEAEQKLKELRDDMEMDYYRQGWKTSYFRRKL